MPKFFFHLNDESGVVRDPDGLELPTEEAAKACALRSARDLAGEMVKSEGVLPLWQSIAVEDEHGATIEVVSFRDAVRIEPD
jgi:hypothetical protein